jgi:hypothetical protein
MYITPFEKVVESIFLAVLAFIIYLFIKKENKKWNNYIEFIGQISYIIYLVFFTMHFPYKKEISTFVFVMITVTTTVYFVEIYKGRLQLAGMLFIKLFFYVLLILIFIRGHIFTYNFASQHNESQQIHFVIDTAKSK